MTDRLHTIALLIDACRNTPDEGNLLHEVSASTGLAVPRLWGVLGLAEDLRFVERTEGRISQTATGRKFASYMASQPEGHAAPPRTDDTLCVSLPPGWRTDARMLLGAAVEETSSGEQRVARGAQERLYIVTPFLSPDVLQYKLRDVLKPNTEVVVFTSDPSIGREDWQTNHLRRRLTEILGRRFGRVRLYHYDSEGMIIHAKLWLSEAGYFLTSANVKGDSANDNLEVGLHGSNPAIAGTLRRFLEGLPAMEGVRCLA